MLDETTNTGQVLQWIDLDCSFATILYDLAYFDHCACTFAYSQLSMAHVIKQAKVRHAGDADL